MADLGHNIHVGVNNITWTKAQKWRGKVIPDWTDFVEYMKKNYGHVYSHGDAWIQVICLSVPQRKYLYCCVKHYSEDWK